MKEKLYELKRGKKVAVFDKKMVFALGTLSDKKICCREEENQFTCWVANDEEQMKGYKKWCKVMNYNMHNASALQEFLKGGGIIWLG